MKKRILFLTLILIFCVFTAASAETEEKTKMMEVNEIMAKIAALPAQIDDDLCGGRKDDYKAHMSELAQLIILANETVEDIRLYYPFDLWYIYNTISSEPYCGIGAKATRGFDVAQTSIHSSEGKMDIYLNEDICSCWNIATGREEPTGYMKDGVCRCDIGKRQFSPQIGLNDVDWVTGKPEK